MIITVAGFKGGIGKTTSAIHIAAYLNTRVPTLLIDGDANRSALEWHSRGEGLPFKVIDEKHTARHARHFDSIVIDSEARPNDRDLRTLAEGCDLLILPCTPDALSLSALIRTVDALRAMKADHFRVALTILPPFPSRDGDEARAILQEHGLPVFKGGVRRFVAFQKAALAGVTVDEVKGDPHAADGWQDYVDIAKQIKI